MRIAVIGGDGTGPEVVNEGLKVLEAVAKKVGFEYSLKNFDISGDRYLARGGDPNRQTIPVIEEAEIAELRPPEAAPVSLTWAPAQQPGGRP